MFGLTGFEEQEAIKVCAEQTLEMGDDALFDDSDDFDNDTELENQIELREECGYDFN